MQEKIKSFFYKNIKLQKIVLKNISKKICNANNVFVNSLLKGNKIITCGNGISAAIAQQFTTRMMNSFENNRPSLPSISINTDNILMSAINNEGLHEEIYAKQIKALGNHGDVLFIISTKINNRDIIKAIEISVNLGINIVVLNSCNSRVLKKILGVKDIEICIPSHSTSRVNELHTIIVNCLCNLIDYTLFPCKK
ncbi:SIS domain-containing protein [Buchnera aphidicola (Taiwanaphis decaspermi)]|uniref:SIS domain-containing protein n=1 Tax=Buchnera aphidicola TaxID=9 RepID=UPI0031B7FC79